MQAARVRGCEGEGGVDAGFAADLDRCEACRLDPAEDFLDGLAAALADGAACAAAGRLVDGGFADAARFGHGAVDGDMGVTARARRSLTKLVTSQALSAPRVIASPPGACRSDARHAIVRCPRKKVMPPARSPCPAGTKSARWFRAGPDACRTCPLRAQGIPDDRPTHRVHGTGPYVDVLRARRKRLARGQAETRLHARHRWWVEGAHGLAKTLHGMARAARRGRETGKSKPCSPQPPSTSSDWRRRSCLS